MNQSRSYVLSSDPLRLTGEPLGRVNLQALRRGVMAATLGAAVLSTLAYAGQESGRLAASARPALTTIDAPARSPLADMVGADARLFTRTAQSR